MEKYSLDMRFVEHKIYEAYNILTQLPVNNKNVIIFDIDDTLLFPQTGLPIEPVVSFYDTIKQLGIIPVIITARIATSENIEHTQNELKKINITGYQNIFFRPITKFDIPFYKLMSRKAVIDNGYNIIMSVGDMYWDVGEYGGYPILLRQNFPFSNQIL
jgi:predicted secreted acid phosphatase